MILNTVLTENLDLQSIDSQKTKKATKKSWIMRAWMQLTDKKNHHCKKSPHDTNFQK